MLYEVRWTKSRKRFAWVDVVTGEETLVYESEGLCEIVGSDNAMGRLHIVVDKLVVEDEYAWAFQELQPSLIPDGAEQLPIADVVRICYRRAAQDWRIRDENGTGNTTFVNTIRGQLLMDWHDHASHLFGHNDVWIHDEIAYLVPKVGAV